MFKFTALTASALLTLSFADIVLASVGVHCGTTDDATFSDCQALVDPGTWNAAWAGNSNVCHYTNILKGDIDHEAFNVACHGNCCVYAAGGDGFNPDRDVTRQQAADLLGCADTAANKVNALNTFADGHGVCISNGNGCGDCFDDSDFIV